MAKQIKLEIARENPEAGIGSMQTCSSLQRNTKFGMHFSERESQAQTYIMNTRYTSAKPSPSFLSDGWIRPQLMS